jgi:hypothetical protein
VFSVLGASSGIGSSGSRLISQTDGMWENSRTTAILQLGIIPSAFTLIKGRGDNAKSIEPMIKATENLK